MPRTLIPLRPNLGVLQIGIKSQDTVMSDSEDSTVTYTAVSSPFEDGSDIVTTLLDFVPELMYPEYMPQEDEILSAEEQPLPATAASPCNTLKSEYAAEC
ncbi:hypothetical protein Tco_0225791 [Tanacetum coccineum]